MIKPKVCDKLKTKVKCEPKKSNVKGTCAAKKSVSILSSCCCCECGEIIGGDSKALQCERCVTETWKCANCFWFSDELYDELTTSDGNSLHWFCPKCEVCVADNMPVVVEKIIDNLDKLAEKTCGIEHQLVENFQISRKLNISCVTESVL